MTVVEYNKYQRLKKQVSYDSGTTWNDVVPYEYQRGSLIERNSRDCGYSVEYQWLRASSDASILVKKVGETTLPTDTCKVNGVQQKVSMTSNQDIINMASALKNAHEEYVGSLVNHGGVAGNTSSSESNSPTSGYTSYWVNQKWITYDGTNWLPAYPPVYSASSVVAYDPDPDCGYEGEITPIYRWVEDGYECVTETVEVSRIYRWQNNGDTTCINGDLYQILQRQYSDDSGATWSNVDPAQYQTGSLIEEDSTECEARLYVDYNLQQGENTLLHNGNGQVTAAWVDYRPVDAGNIITYNAPSAGTYYSAYATVSKTAPSYALSGLSNVTDIFIGETYMSVGYYFASDCPNLGLINLGRVQDIFIGAFQNCTSLTEVTFPATIQTIDDEAFMGCTSLTVITLEGDYPPTLGERVFNHAPLQHIYVTEECYLNIRFAPGWSYYASIISIQH